MRRRGLMVVLCLWVVSCTQDRDWDNPFDAEGTAEPTAPSELKAVALNDSTIELTWQDSQQKVGYKIWRSVNGDLLQEIGSVPQNVTHFLDEGLQGGYRYSYSVAAFAANGREERSHTEGPDIDRGRDFLDKNAYDKAAEAFSDALAKDPDCEAAYYYLSLTYARWGKQEEALSEYRKLLECDSKYADDEELQQRVAIFLGFQEALDDDQLTEMIRYSLGFAVPPSVELGKAFLKIKAYEEAAEQFQRILNAAPNNEEGLYYLTLTYLRWGKEKQAVSEYKRLLELNSSKADDEELVTWIISYLHLDPYTYEVVRLADIWGYDPCFSPDGTKIAFASYRDGNQDIYVINLDGSDERRLTEHEAYDANPCFSPDGTKIAFASYRDGNYDIYVMNSDGSSERRLTSSEYWETEPSFSPDGKQIVFRSGLLGGIYVMNSSGSNQERLTNEHWGNNYSPSFSPDGRQIVFESGGDICVMYSYGEITEEASARRYLTSNETVQGSPSFSPDGRQIVFHSKRDGNYEIYMMDSDGSDQQRLTFNEVDDEDPSFSPNSREIVFVSDRGSIFLMDLSKKTTHRTIDRAEIAQALGIKL